MNKQMKRKNNLKLFPIYKMLSWDLLFYYSIVFLFLTIVKEVSVADILFAGAFFPLFRALFQIGCVGVVDHIGKRNSLLLGNAMVSIGVLIIILGNGLSALIISNIFKALGFVLKGMCEPIILHSSIPETKTKPDIFSKLDSRGSSYYFLLSAISAATTGFLFVVNSYLPMIICFVFSLLAILLSARFEEIEEEENEKHKNSANSQNMKKYLKDLRQAFKFIFKSNRLKSLLLYSSIMLSFLMVFLTFKNDLLTYLHVPAEYFAIIHAIALFISSITSKKQLWIHEKFRNKTLAWLSLPAAFSLLLTGLFLLGNFNIIAIYIMSGIMFFIFAAVRAPYWTLISRYYNSFSTPNIITKIYTAKSLIENLAQTLVFFFASWLVENTDIAHTLTVFGCIIILLFIFTLEYMKTKFGLKPEKYSKKDIEFKVLN